MNRAGIISSYDKDKISSFLRHTEYKKFNLWPNVTDKNIVDFLSNEVDKIQDAGKIFIASQFNKITALLGVRNLEWDTRHFGFKCAKIEYILTDKTLSTSAAEESLGQIMADFKKYCVESDIKFVNVHADSFDSTLNRALQKADFRYISTSIDCFFNPFNTLPEAKGEAEVGAIRPDEIGFFKKISPLYYFKGGRFYLDGNFNREKVSRMYEELIEFSSKNNYIMLVYRIKNRPAGLFICERIVAYESFSDLRVALLRFLVIDPRFRNRYAAYNLFLKTLGYLKDKSNLITSRLDIHNLPSLNLHSKLGFRFNYTHNIYHWWNKAR